MLVYVYGIIICLLFQLYETLSIERKTNCDDNLLKNAFFIIILCIQSCVNLKVTLINQLCAENGSCKNFRVILFKQIINLSV